MNEEEEETNSLRDLIQNLTANMESNFGKLHEELCGLRQEMKEEIDMLKSNIKGVEKSVDEIWAIIEDMKEATRALKDSKTRVSMGLTDRRKTAQNLVDSRKN